MDRSGRKWTKWTKVDFGRILLGIYFLAVPLDFQQLKKENLTGYIGKRVAIRGFVYCTEEGKWILAGEPNLRSCCLGTPEKISQQIFLSKGFDGTSPSQTILVEGIFTMDQTAARYYKLDDPVVVQESRNFPWISFFFCVILLLAIIAAAI